MLPPQGRTDCHVAALLATAAYHDSLNSRLVPLGAMTVVFCTLPCLLSIGNSPKSGDPSVTADAVPASRCGSVTARGGPGPRAGEAPPPRGPPVGGPLAAQRYSQGGGGAPGGAPTPPPLRPPPAAASLPSRGAASRQRFHTGAAIESRRKPEASKRDGTLPLTARSPSRTPRHLRGRRCRARPAGAARRRRSPTRRCAPRPPRPRTRTSADRAASR